VRTFADGFFYCNGIAFEPDGTVVVVERRGLQRVHADGSREWVIETLGRAAATASASTPTAASTSRRRSSTASASSSPTAPSSTSWPIEGKGLTTNCCFGGPDLRTLFVTDAIPGNLVAFEGMPHPRPPAPGGPARPKQTARRRQR
jgi:hypothetical protein